MSWLQENWGTILVALIVIGLVVLDIHGMIKRKKQAEACGRHASCFDCPLAKYECGKLDKKKPLNS